MNLKFKMSKSLTAVAEFISDTECIFSDECSPSSIKTLRLMTNDKGFDNLVEDVEALTIELASSTRFKPVVCMIMGKHMDVRALEAEEVASSSDNPFTTKF